MNILFFTFNKVCPTCGGTERTTISTATGLTEKYGCRCFSLYESPSYSAKVDCFVDECCWAGKNKMSEKLSLLKKYVIDNNISVVIIQGSFIHTKLFSQCLEGTRCKVLFAHHFEPGSELRFLSFAYTINHSSCKSLKGFVRLVTNIILFPYLHKKSIESLKRNYHDTYNYAGKVVLLSKSFIEPYKEFAGIHSSDKFVTIPNALSFSEFLKPSDLLLKKKVVLIVARFDDKFKNISLALRIWAKIQKSEMSKDWILKLVGHGKDLKLYQNIISNENIPNVSIEGRQNPVPYYKEASLFMMTSNSESWGLTLTEAMQFGTVPIAMNTYPTLSEIITNNMDGVIVSEGDVEGYASGMLSLMKDGDKRERMAIAAIESSKRFSQETISDKWYGLLTSLFK